MRSTSACPSSLNGGGPGVIAVTSPFEDAATSRWPRKQFHDTGAGSHGVATMINRLGRDRMTASAAICCGCAGQSKRLAELRRSESVSCSRRVQGVALPETKLGLIPAAGGIRRLIQIVGLARTKEIVLFGRELDAPTALGRGVVNALETDTVAAAIRLASSLHAPSPCGSRRQRSMPAILGMNGYWRTRFRHFSTNGSCRDEFDDEHWALGPT